MKSIWMAIVLVAWSAQAAPAMCTAEAKEKKLAGAAQDSFAKKCVAEAVGS